MFSLQVFIEFRYIKNYEKLKVFICYYFYIKIPVKNIKHCLLFINLLQLAWFKITFLKNFKFKLCLEFYMLLIKIF